MKSTWKKINAAVLFIAISFAGYSQQSFTESSAETLRIAEEYLEIYNVQKFDELADYYTDSTIFNDITYKEAFRVDMPFVGRDNVIAGLKKGFNGTSNVSFNEINKFSSGSYAIFDSIITFTYGGKNYKFPVISLIKVKEGRIIEHIDYGDYASMVKQSK